MREKDEDAGGGLVGGGSRGEKDGVSHVEQTPGGSVGMS